jgi:hypothetical protein
MNNKRGQFYLIATALIVLIIFGLVSVSNAAIVQPRPVRFYDLSTDYGAETARVIDYGIYSNSVPAVIDEKIQNISMTFAESSFAKDPNVRLVYIYGNTDNVNAMNLAVVNGKVSYCGSGSCSATLVGSLIGLEEINYTKAPDSNIINVKLGGNEYEFTLTQQDNFYFVIQTTTAANERIVSVKS